MHSRNLTKLLSSYFQVNPFKLVYERDLLQRFRVSEVELSKSLTLLLTMEYINRSTSGCYILRRR